MGGFQLTPSGKIDRNAIPGPEGFDPACVDWTGAGGAAGADAGARREDEVYLSDLSEKKVKPPPAADNRASVSGATGRVAAGPAGGGGGSRGGRALARHILDIAEEVR